MKKLFLYLCAAMFLCSCGIHSREEETEQGLLSLEEDIIIMTEDEVYLSINSNFTSLQIDTIPFQKLPQKIYQKMTPGSLYSSEYEKIEDDNYIVGPWWYWITLIICIIFLIERFDD